LMNSRLWRANALLLLTAIIWGFGFVAQQAGATSIGPMTYNAIRFGLGGLALLALYPFLRRFEPPLDVPWRKVAAAGCAAGLVLFTASAFQTIGIKYTSVGKASFITGLYVVLVPILGLLWKQRATPAIWLGALVAVVGLYLLSVSGDFRIETGDLLVMAGAFFWAIHVQLLGFLARRVDPLRIAIGQMLFTSLLSIPAGLFFEQFSWSQLSGATIPILYGGLFSVGIAFTLQIIGQRDTHPGHAAIIMVSESLFGAFAGWLMLGELLGARELAGCALILVGMLLSQAGLFFNPAPVPGTSAPALPDEKAGY
jgi:drug/metabolite transporter (DMT)-like permease